MTVDTSHSKPPSPSIARLSIWETCSFGMTHAACAGLLRILGLSGFYRFARAFGWVEYAVNFRRRRRFSSALRRVWGRSATPTERRHETRSFFMRTRCDKLFYLIFDCLSHKQGRALLSVGNEPILQEAASRGKGVYIALSHHGPQHVIAMLLALHDYKTAGVRDRREGALRRYVQQRLDRRSPEFSRLRVIFADAYPREIYRCFKSGYLLGSTMDVGRVRDPRQRGITVNMFGEQRRLPSGPLHVALKCKAPVLQGFIIPEDGFRYRLEIETTLLDPETVTNEEAAVEQAMHTYAANVERYVRRHPSLLSRV